MTIDPWTFQQAPASPRRANVTLLVFGQELEEGPLSLSRFGIPTPESVANIDVRRHERARDPAWFDGFRSGSMRAIATSDLGPRIAALDAATVACSIALDIDGPADLTYLQAAWGYARYLIAMGGSVVLDAQAIAYHDGDTLPPPGAPLDTEREVRVVFETSADRPDAPHALHTRGLRKFGAPDLVTLCRDDDVPLLSTAIRELADGMARGLDLGTPRHRLEVAPGVHWVLVPDEHGLGDLLQLNNAARVLVDSDGHDLAGVASRLRRAPS
ncbi:MAG: hypothetical protein JNL83_00310 [Myxococcales bacterium]|nr:hypothetical protein [Myxococcales bacterium]